MLISVLILVIVIENNAEKDGKYSRNRNPVHCKAEPAQFSETAVLIPGGKKIKQCAAARCYKGKSHSGLTDVPYR
jgi:hypothetical protein